MENKRLAILLIGKQNSGKTTTIHHFDKMYDERELDKVQCKRGWRHLQIFKEKLGALFVSMYFVPASPTETNFPLRSRFEFLLPEIIIVAEQKNGSEFHNTMDFLNENDYKIKIFEIKEGTTETWSRWKEDNSNKQDILTKRGVDICNTVREFIIKMMS
tara:strand:+ start:804 stop:1280 length:477 start_codon:yes stop_codon:yes gene_type:complete